MKRLGLVIAAAAVSCALLGACGSKNTTTGGNDAQGSVSSAAPSTTEKTTKTTKNEDSTDTTSKKGGTTTTTKGDKTSIPGGGDITIPSIPGGNGIPDAGKIQKCAEYATAYAGLFAPLVAGNDAQMQAAIDQLDKMKGEVPDNIKDDIETIENGLKNAKGLTGIADFLSSSEFNKANDDITQYLTVTCSTGQ